MLFWKSRHYQKYRRDVGKQVISHPGNHRIYTGNCHLMWWCYRGYYPLIIISSRCDFTPKETNNVDIVVISISRCEQLDTSVTNWRLNDRNAMHDIASCQSLNSKTSYQQIPVLNHWMASLIARFKGPTWGPPRADRTQVGPMLTPWILLSGFAICQAHRQ